MRTTAIAVLLCLASAARGEEARVNEEFYPTAVGTRWVMVTEYEDGTESYVDDIRITEVKVVNGYRKWRIRTVSRPRPANPLQAIANAFTPPHPDEVFEGWEYYDVGREAYVFQDLDEDFEGEPAVPLVYVPARAQDVFEDEEGVVTTVIAVDRKVKVPAGEFECIVYEVDYSGEGRTEVAERSRPSANPPRLFPVLFDEESARDDAASDDDDASDEDLPVAPGFPDDGAAEEAPSGEEEAPADEEEFLEESASIVVEYWAKGVGLVRTEEFTIEDDGERTLYSRQNLVSFHTPQPTGRNLEVDSPAKAGASAGQ